MEQQGDHDRPFEVTKTTLRHRTAKAPLLQPDSSQRTGIGQSWTFILGVCKDAQVRNESLLRLQSRVVERGAGLCFLVVGLSTSVVVGGGKQLGLGEETLRRAGDESNSIRGLGGLCLLLGRLSLVIFILFFELRSKCEHRQKRVLVEVFETDVHRIFQLFLDAGSDVGDIVGSSVKVSHACKVLLLEHGLGHLDYHINSEMHLGLDHGLSNVTADDVVRSWLLER